MWDDVFNRDGVLHHSAQKFSPSYISIRYDVCLHTQGGGYVYVHVHVQCTSPPPFTKYTGNYHQIEACMSTTLQDK